MIELDRKAWRFFLDNAGYATPPGRVVCAAELARAETFARDAEWSYEWEYDDEPWECSDGCQPTEVLGCILRDENGVILASLWGIGDPDRNYRRVVEAELASEAYGDWARCAS